MGWFRTAVASACLLGAGTTCTRAPAPAGHEGEGAATELKVPQPISMRKAALQTTGCIADVLGKLEADAARPAACPEEGDDGSCARACDAGDAVACYLHARVLKHDRATADQATGIYKRSCALGLAIGCTNYAAALWRADDPAGLPCAQQIFEKACAAGEPWGCGMVGRMILDDKDAGLAERKRGQAILERACSELGSFPCRILALELELGRLGPYKRGRIRKLLARACATGDSDSCGTPKSAAATFR